MYPLGTSDRACFPVLADPGHSRAGRLSDTYGHNQQHHQTLP